MITGLTLYKLFATLATSCSVYPNDLIPEDKERITLKARARRKQIVSVPTLEEMLKKCVKIGQT